MTAIFKARMKSILKWFIALFVFLFIFRFIYGYVAMHTNQSDDIGSNFFSSLENVRKNYASEKFATKGNSIPQQAIFATNQKFEKTASAKSKSSEFDKDENLIKTKAKAFNAVIQYEQNLGQKGNRQIHLLIGVSPNLFDSFYAEVQKIGVLKATEITKVDKTNYYRELNAKKSSLENTLKSLLELKAKSGQISDYVTLHDKILEIETKLQELGVELGNFDVENEYCTVKLSLYEGATEKNISIIQRIKISLEWTIKYYAVIVLAVLIVLLVSLVLLVILDKLKIIKAITSKINE